MSQSKTSIVLGCFEHILSASSPSSATKTSYPRFRNPCPSISRIALSSSTTRIVSIGCHLSPMLPHAEDRTNGLTTLLSITVPSVISGSLRERPETIWRPLESSLGLAGNEYRLAGLLRWRLVVRGWPRCFVGVGYPRSEWFAVCHVQDRFQE